VKLPGQREARVNTWEIGWEIQLMQLQLYFVFQSILTPDELIRSLYSSSAYFQALFFTMESLLSLSFDNLSSYDGSKIRKGLRQLEGLLAQICLSHPSSSSSHLGHERRQSIVAASTTRDAGTLKDLAALPSDPAFREFFKLQEGFEWNCAMRLVGCLERLMGRGADGSNDLLIVATLDLLRGVLLMHPPSSTLFAREIYMNVRVSCL
jgi:Cell division control protein 14, SIN component